MSDRVLAWILRAAWAALPFTVGPQLGAALHHHDMTVRTAASTAAWAVWALALLATLVAHPLSLTVLRCAAPAVVAAAGWAAAAGGPGGVENGLAGVWAAATTVLVLLPAVGVLQVNGPAYPNERRLLLAPPAVLLLGPIELAWAAVVGLPTAALFLLAAGVWVPGAVAAVAAAVAVPLLGRSLFQLSLRWVVFVPAGVVLHDALALVDPVLFVRAVVSSLGPAPADTEGVDLTQRAPGLALELHLREPLELTLVTPGERAGRRATTDRVLFTPSRPGAVLAEATARQLPVATAA